MSAIVGLVLGVAGGVVVHLVTTQLGLLIFSTGAPVSSLVTLIGVIAAAVLVTLSVFAGNRWPQVALAYSAAIAALVLVGVLGGGRSPGGMMLSPLDLFWLGGTSALPIAAAAGAAAAALIRIRVQTDPRAGSNHSGSEARSAR